MNPFGSDWFDLKMLKPIEPYFTSIMKYCKIFVQSTSLYVSLIFVIRLIDIIYISKNLSITLKLTYTCSKWRILISIKCRKIHCIGGPTSLGRYLNWQPLKPTLSSELTALTTRLSRQVKHFAFDDDEISTLLWQDLLPSHRKSKWQPYVRFLIFWVCLGFFLGFFTSCIHKINDNDFIT